MTVARPIIITGHCRFCGHSSTIFLSTPQDEAGFEMWLHGSQVDACFPHWDYDKQVTMLTGSHPECIGVVSEGDSA